MTQRALLETIDGIVAGIILTMESRVACPEEEVLERLRSLYGQLHYARERLVREHPV